MTAATCVACDGLGTDPLGDRPCVRCMGYGREGYAAPGDLCAVHGPAQLVRRESCDHQWVLDDGTYHCALCGSIWLRPALRVVAP